uniref:Uncharacterized LOC105915690 n=1 Tax=Fundulus heteroclitus TaxID=8078 RepID=A0A3Q2QYT0_FUNHE
MKMPICHVFAVERASCIIQDGGVIRAKVGETVSLNCSCRDVTVSFLSWYKQSPGEKPHIVSRRMRHSTNVEIYPTYKERFQVAAHIQDGINNLIITNLQLADSGTYYCGILEFGTTEFGQGVFLYIRINDMQFNHLQPVPKPLQIVDSVNLSFNVYAEQCTGGQSLCLFREGASRPALMCSRDGDFLRTSDEKLLWKNSSPNLELTSEKSSNIGTYYFVLTCCQTADVGERTGVKVTVYFLSAALAVSIVGLLVLCFLWYKLRLKLRSSCKVRASHVTCSAASTSMVDSLQYAGLSFKRNNEQHNKEENLRSFCVYSSVKSKQSDRP